MNELIAFLVATVISFWGSLQLGVVNVQVIRESLVGHYKGALKLALGGVLPEIPYTAAAFFLIHLLDGKPQVQNIVSWIVIIALSVLGSYYLFFAKPIVLHEVDQPEMVKTKYPVLKGFLLASLNPQLVFFWSSIIFLIEAGSILPEWLFPNFSLDHGTFFSPQYTFILGAAFGAFVILFIYARLAYRYKQRIANVLKFNFNYITGGIFILIAFLELVRHLLMT